MATPSDIIVWSVCGQNMFVNNSVNTYPTNDMNTFFNNIYLTLFKLLLELISERVNLEWTIHPILLDPLKGMFKVFSSW